VAMSRAERRTQPLDDIAPELEALISSEITR
jgi:hypothetical protein